MSFCKVKPRAPAICRPAAAALVTAAVAVLTPVARAEGLLDFEGTPSGATPTDNAALTTPYTIPGGTVRFFFDANANNTYQAGTDEDPVFEHSGNDSVNGFTSGYYSGLPDTARPGFENQLGTFFLRQAVGVPVSTLAGPFIADYDTTSIIRELSGEIWDIDGTDALGSEQWRVDVLSVSGAVLATQLSPAGTTGDLDSFDSLPWTFQFRNLPDGVDKLRLTFVGTKPSAIGLAFNNFSPTVAVPEASTVMAGAFLLPLLRRRRSNA